MRGAPRIAIIDDHALVRSGLGHMLVSQLGAEIVHEGLDPEAVLDVDPLPDMVLLDLDLGERSADPLVAARLQAAGCSVLIVSAMGTRASISGMLEAGVSGFVSKREPQDILVSAVRTVLDDGVWTSPEVAAIMVSGALRPSLSPSQEQVLVMYASGMTIESVARHLGMAPGTATTHLKRARAKYNELGRDTRTRVDLYREARNDGLIED